MRHQLLLSLSVAFVAGCTSSMQFVNKEYVCEKNQACITLLPLTKDVLMISNRNDVYNDFKKDGRKAEDIVGDTLYKTVFKVLADSIKKIETVKLPSSACMEWTQSSDRFISVKKNIGKDSIPMEFNVPKKEVLDSLSSKPTIVIVLNKVAISRTNGSSGAPGMFMAGSQGGGSFVGGTAGSMPTFEATVDYIIWDYRMSKIVACGQMQCSEGILFAATADTWRGLFRGIGKKIVNKTPFKR